jgi:uncharacterized protein
MVYRKRFRRRNVKGFWGWLMGLSITGWLILVNVVFSFIVFTILTQNEGAIDLFALKPVNILAGQYLWTLITHMFAHGGIFHLFINMFVLFSLGGLSERIIGRKRFFWFYLSSGIFAGILSVLASGFLGTTDFGARVFGSPEVFMVGASGAIFAIAGLFVVLLPRLKFAIIFLPFFSLPAYIMIPLVLFLTWFATLVANLPIGNVAHFGGFLAGLAYGYYLKTKYRRKVMLLQRQFR